MGLAATYRPGQTCTRVCLRVYEVKCVRVKQAAALLSDMACMELLSSPFSLESAQTRGRAGNIAVMPLISSHSCHRITRHSHSPRVAF